MTLKLEAKSLFFALSAQMQYQGPTLWAPDNLLYHHNFESMQASCISTDRPCAEQGRIVWLTEQAKRVGMHASLTEVRRVSQGFPTGHNLPTITLQQPEIFQGAGRFPWLICCIF